MALALQVLKLYTMHIVWLMLIMTVVLTGLVVLTTLNIYLAFILQAPA